MIGADPEFLLKREGVYINANDPFAEGIFNSNFPIREWGREVGSDGSPAEMRPNPNETAEGLVDEIGKLMVKVGTAFGPDVTIRAGAGGCITGLNRYSSDHNIAIGGHIHLGDMEHNAPVLGGTGNPLTQSELAVLDVMLGLPSRLIEEPDSSLARSRTSYGGWGTATSNARLQPHGLEYRMPSSWLVSPDWALRHLALADALHKEVMEKGFQLPVDQLLKFCKLARVWGNKNTKICEEWDWTAARTFFEVVTLPLWSALCKKRPTLTPLLQPWAALIGEEGCWEEEKDALESWGVPNLIFQSAEVEVHADRSFPKKVSEMVTELLNPLSSGRKRKLRKDKINTLLLLPPNKKSFFSSSYGTPWAVIEMDATCVQAGVEQIRRFTENVQNPI